MVTEMFRRSKSKTNVNSVSESDSKESLSLTGNQLLLVQTSSSETLGNSRDRLHESSLSIQSISRALHHEVYFLGMVQDVNLGACGGGKMRDLDVQLIDKVEEAQLEGKISLLPKDDSVVKITLSKHGVKVLDPQKKEVLQRHPLHTVSQIVYYTDSFFKSNLALKIGQVGRPVYDCYVFQCSSEEQAQLLCQTLKDVFDRVTHRMP